MPISLPPPVALTADALALTSTQVVASEAAMLALTAEPGDLAVRTDLNKTFILVTAPASVLGNWQELLTPTDLVSSVAGKTGAVTLDAADINTALAFTAANAAALNASNLTAGTIPDARFPAVLPAISGANLTNLPGVSGVVSDAATNTVSDALILRHETSGTAAAGFGTGVLLQGENAAGTMKSMASIDAVYISAADGAEHTQLVFKNHFGGVESTFLTLMQQYADTYLSAPGALILGGGSSVQVGGSASVVYLTTGYSNSWLLDSAAAFKPSADITYDLGTPANRVKDIHAMSVKTSGRSYLAVPNSAPTDGDIANGAFSAYLDEAGNALKIRVRYSDGTLKLATIALA